MLGYGTCSLGISQFYLHTHTFNPRNRNEPYLPLPSQPQLVLICRSRRDGWLSRPWCEVAPAEIRTCNIPIANPALYHTATSAPSQSHTHIKTALRSGCSQVILRHIGCVLSSDANNDWTCKDKDKDKDKDFTYSYLLQVAVSNRYQATTMNTK